MDKPQVQIGMMDLVRWQTVFGATPLLKTLAVPLSSNLNPFFQIQLALSINKRKNLNNVGKVTSKRSLKTFPITTETSDLVKAIYRMRTEENPSAKKKARVFSKPTT